MELTPEQIALLARILAGELTAEALAAMSDEELTALAADVQAIATALDVENVSELPEGIEGIGDATELAVAFERLADAGDAVVQVVETREAEATAAREAEEAAAAEAEARRVAARERLLGAPVTEGESSGEGEGEGEGAPAGESRELQPASAGRRSLGSLTRHRPPHSAPAGNPAGPRVTTQLVAAADVAGFGAGSELGDWSAVGKALAARLRGLGNIAGYRDHVTAEPVLVASIKTEYPTERRLTAEDAQGNLDRIEGAFRGPDGITAAAGGLCTDLPVDYTIPEVGTLDRPFRDSLARFAADRGGIRTNVAPSLTQADAGVGFWTLANDANPGFADPDGPAVPVDERLAAKPVVEFDCGDYVESYVYAVTLRTRFSNARARFNPEVVASNARMGLVSFARLAELRLMADFARQSTAVTAASSLGASKDFFGHLDALCARKRYRARTPNAPLHSWIPGWVRDMLRADFVRQMPAGDPTAQYAIADATLAAMCGVRNVNVTWLTEDLDHDLGIGAPQDPGAILTFPDTFRWFLANEGEMLFLDAGELDLGVVRDSALNATNRYETFYETWEGLHFRGTEKPLVIASTLNPSGAAAGLVANAATAY